MDNSRSLALALAFPSFELLPTSPLYFWTTPYRIREHTSLRAAEAELLTWLDGQTNVVSLCFPFLVDDDDNAIPPTALPATLARTRVLSAPATPRPPFLSPMPPLLPLPPTPTPTKDTFMRAADMTLKGPPRLIILLAPSRHLIHACITIDTPIYAGFHPTSTLDLNLVFKWVGKRPEEKTLCSTVVACPDIEELEVEGEGGEECWCPIVTHIKS